MSQKKLSVPVWWKNTYFWISALLFIIAMYGLVRGQETIRDPGQRREDGLVWFYFAASAIMLINGLLSHRATVKHYEEVSSEVKTNGSV